MRVDIIGAPFVIEAETVFEDFVDGAWIELGQSPLSPVARRSPRSRSRP